MTGGGEIRGGEEGMGEGEWAKGRPKGRPCLMRQSLTRPRGACLTHWKGGREAERRGVR